MEQHSSLCWRPLKRQLSHLECLSLSGMLFSVSHYSPSSSAWVTAIPSSGHSLREASLSSIRFCCYNLSSYSLLFLNYTNSTCNHFSSKTVIAKCNYTFMSIWQVNQSVLGVETIYSGHSENPKAQHSARHLKNVCGGYYEGVVLTAAIFVTKPPIQVSRYRSSQPLRRPGRVHLSSEPYKHFLQAL